MRRRGRAAAIGVAAITTVQVLAGCAGTSGEGPREVSLTLGNTVWTDVIKEKIPEFEKESGIKVNLTVLGEDQLSDHYNVKLNAGTDELDVMMYRPLQEGLLFGKNGYFADLTGRVAEDASWNWADFQPGPVSMTTYEGKVVGVPLITESQVLYYRTDLLKEAGIGVPATLADLESAAAALKAAHPGMAGFVARSARSAAVTQFSSFLYSYGGDWVVDGKAAVGSPEAIQAYEFYTKLLREYGPDNVTTDINWQEASAMFAQGDAVFFSDASSQFRNVGLPENSKVADVVGVAPFPAGPAGARPYNVPSWAVGVSATSKHQDESWEFIKWATSPKVTLDVQSKGVPCARTSVWADPQGIAGFPESLAAAIAANGANGVGYDRPRVINVADAREIVGGPIVAGVVGDDVAASAATAQTDFQALLDKEAA